MVALKDLLIPDNMEEHPVTYQQIQLIRMSLEQLRSYFHADGQALPIQFIDNEALEGAVSLACSLSLSRSRSCSLTLSLSLSLTCSSNSHVAAAAVRPNHEPADRVVQPAKGQERRGMARVLHGSLRVQRHVGNSLSG